MRARRKVEFRERRPCGNTETMNSLRLVVMSGWKIRQFIEGKSWVEGYVGLSCSCPDIPSNMSMLSTCDQVVSTKKRCVDAFGLACLLRISNLRASRTWRVPLTTTRNAQFRRSLKSSALRTAADSSDSYSPRVRSANAARREFNRRRKVART